MKLQKKVSLRHSLLPRAALTFLLLLSLQSCNAKANLPSPLINAKTELPLQPATESWLTARELAVIVNESDPLSVKIAQYYQQRRNIPQRNIISIKFPPNRPVLSAAQFKQIKAKVDAQTPNYIQAYALTWAAPYRVGCMSITSAFALGFAETYCAQSCKPTKASPYFNSNSTQPYKNLRLRPTMAIAATSFEEAKALIDRGVASDGTFPRGTAYLMNTTDKARNVRAGIYRNVTQNLATYFKIQKIEANTLNNKSDVMFYFTGLAKVDNLKTNRFLPGAIADHLTSYGGMLTDSSQMSILRWLEAGATGSYGAVVEPCNFLEKFPHPGLVMFYYLKGNTLIEAYWKSVAWPGQGIFVGEPLARPFSR